MPRQMNRSQEITFNIKQHLGVLETSQTGWTKEVNLVEWNGKPAKLDIREWDPDHEHMSRGVTLRRNETLTLLEILIRSFGKELAGTKAQPAGVKAEKPAEPVPPGEFDDLCIDDSCSCGGVVSDNEADAADSTEDF